MVSAGPFWTAMMAAATTTSFKKLYTDYVLYLILGWFPLIATISLIMATLGSLGTPITIGMHLVGSAIIFWMAWKIFNSVPGKAGHFVFGWKEMTLLSWTNPKVWLLAPIGYLGAQISNNVALNFCLYYFVGVPFFLAGVYVWGMIGRLGAKISLHYVNRFNGLLMALFGGYLLYTGFKLWAAV